MATSDQDTVLLNVPGRVTGDQPAVGESLAFFERKRYLSG